MSYVDLSSCINYPPTAECIALRKLVAIIKYFQNLSCESTTEYCFVVLDIELEQITEVFMLFYYFELSQLPVFYFFPALHGFYSKLLLLLMKTV